MELDEALGRISAIRAQLARTETFRDFRSLTVGFSGVLGIAAAVIQANFLPQPSERIGDYLVLWCSVALVSVIVVGIELAYRCTITDSPLKRRLMLQAVLQFAPCLVAGAIFTIIVDRRAIEIAWTLPGVWALLFSLGVFACRPFLPPAAFWIGVHYLAAGTLILLIGDGPYALSPWMMAGAFGVGQLLTAGVLYFTLERNDGSLQS